MTCGTCRSHPDLELGQLKERGTCPYFGPERRLQLTPWTTGETPSAESISISNVNRIVRMEQYRKRK